MRARAAIGVLVAGLAAGEVQASDRTLGLREELPPPALQEPLEDQPASEPRPREVPRSWVELELALSDDAFWGTLSSRFDGGDGCVSGSLFANTDDDLAASLRVMRLGGPSGELPLRLGVGAGFYAAFDDRDNADAYALALTGAAEWDLRTAFPASLGAEVSFAPDVTSFEAADTLLDFAARFELEVSRSATAFFGYRHFEIGRAGGPDDTLERGLHFGVRLAL